MVKTQFDNRTLRDTFGYMPRLKLRVLKNFYSRSLATYQKESGYSSGGASGFGGVQTGGPRAALERSPRQLYNNNTPAALGPQQPGGNGVYPPQHMVFNNSLPSSVYDQYSALYAQDGTYISESPVSPKLPEDEVSAYLFTYLYSFIYSYFSHAFRIKANFPYRVRA